MSRSSQRTFHQRIAQLLLSAAVTTAVLKKCQAASSDRAFGPTITNKFLAEVDPETELLVQILLGNDRRSFYARGVPPTMFPKVESSIKPAKVPG